jgi:hypothetical protein
MSESLRSYSVWYPPAGVSRGSIPSLMKTEYDVGSTVLDKWQNSGPCYVNPIMTLRNYGYVIFGQNTLLLSDSTDTTQSALQSLNVRIAANQIKKWIFAICLGLSFDQNIPRLWNEFRGQLDAKLSSMKTDNGLYDYQIIMDGTSMTTDDVYNSKVKGIVRVSIVRAAKDFDVGFTLSNTGVTFDTKS